MSVRFTAAAVFAAILVAAAPALAWSERPNSQPATNEIAVWAYPSAQNYCPASLQPVTIGGVICCGQPTHVGYRSHVGQRRSQRPQTYVAYGKGFGDDGTGN